MFDSIWVKVRGFTPLHINKNTHIGFFSLPLFVLDCILFVAAQSILSRLDTHALEILFEEHFHLFPENAVWQLPPFIFFVFGIPAVFSLNLTPSRMQFVLLQCS